MRDLAILFACWLAYAVAKKQAWIDPPSVLTGEAPWWAEAMAVMVVGFAVLVGAISLLSTWIAMRATKGRK